MEDCKLTIKDSSLAFLSGFLFSQTMVVLATVLGIAICTAFGMSLDQAKDFFNTAIGYLILTVVLDISLVLTFLFFNRKKENKLISKISWKKVLIYLGLGLISFLALNPIVNCFNILIEKLGYPLQELTYSLNTPNYIISLFSLVLLPAIAEELLFRGLIFKGLKPCGKAFSIIFSALLFSIFHTSIEQTIYPLLLGLLLGVIMYYENNIIYCIMIHCFNNFLALTQMKLGLSLFFAHWTYVLLAFILLAIYLTFVLLFTLKNKSKKTENSKKEYIYFYTSIVVMLLIWILVNLYRIKNF